MTTTVPSPVDESGDARRTQSAALEVSAWGEPFKFFQPHNLCFWVYLALTAVGLFQAVTFFGPMTGFYASTFALSALLCLLFGGAWWLWLRHIDRWERQPVRLLVAGLIWGAVPATFAFAMTANTAMLSIYPKLFGQNWSNLWSAGATAPFTEEAAKLCGFLLLMGLAPRLVRTANDGLILGAFIGLGFAAFEDFLYAAQTAATAFATDPTGYAERTLATRFASGFISHPLFAALVCSGVIYLLGTSAQPRKVARGIGFIIAGMFLHFTWDAATALGDSTPALIFLVMIGSITLGLVLLNVAFTLAAPREHQFVRDILAPEIEAGTVSASELDAVLDRKARKHARKTAPSHRAKRARKHLRRTILDLTHDIAESGGEDTDRVQHARNEVARLRAVAALN